MKGIEKITARIEADAQAEVEEILRSAREKADEIRAGYEAQVQAEAYADDYEDGAGYTGDTEYPEDAEASGEADIQAAGDDADSGMAE